MENYCKGKNVEEPLQLENVPIPNIPSDVLWMKVRGGSKIRDLLDAALKNFDTKKTILWTGYGQAVNKTITCAELMKKQYKNKLFQITKICFREVQEFWDPLVPELDQLVVKRNLPMVHIFLSIDPLNEHELGYQQPGHIVPYNKHRK